jgi:hypothetical protein
MSNAQEWDNVFVIQHPPNSEFPTNLEHLGVNLNRTSLMTFKLKNDHYLSRLLLCIISVHGDFEFESFDCDLRKSQIVSRWHGSVKSSNLPSDTFALTVAETSIDIAKTSTVRVLIFFFDDVV